MKSAEAVVEPEATLKANASGPMLFGDPPHGRGGQIESFVPADPLPAGIGVALRAGTLQRISSRSEL